MSEVSNTLNKYTWSEISRHNDSSDCWIVVDGKVYDITSIIKTHPGGGRVLLCHAGKDATRNYWCAGHSERAHSIMKPLLVGYVVKEADYDNAFDPLNSLVGSEDNDSDCETSSQLSDDFELTENSLHEFHNEI